MEDVYNNCSWRENMAHTFKQTRKYRQGYHKVDKASLVESSFLLLGKVFWRMFETFQNILQNMQSYPMEIECLHFWLNYNSAY